MAKGNKPAAKFKIGWVTATVWANDSGFFNTVLSRSYKDNGDYKETDQMSHGDLPAAIKVLERAEAWIADQQQ